METYLRLEENGNLMLLVARVKGEIVGYYIGFIVPSAHYRDTKCNIEDIFFIHPSRRGGRYAFELFAAVKEENKRRGVKFWKCTAKINTAAPKFLEKLGFKKFEECFYQWGE
jgi:GNAT superfamily N-acetyltransferase